jgi:hypothetical protein
MAEAARQYEVLELAGDTGWTRAATPFTRENDKRTRRLATMRLPVIRERGVRWQRQGQTLQVFIELNNPTATRTRCAHLVVEAAVLGAFAPFFLSASENRLTALPEAIGRLSQLHHLDFYNNRLTVLSKSLRRLTGLKKLFLQKNPDLGLPPEVLGPAQQLEAARIVRRECKRTTGQAGRGRVVPDRN